MSPFVAQVNINNIDMLDSSKRPAIRLERTDSVLTGKAFPDYKAIAVQRGHSSSIAVDWVPVAIFFDPVGKSFSLGRRAATSRARAGWFAWTEDNDRSD
jgi:hypothetical protein